MSDTRRPLVPRRARRTDAAAVASVWLRSRHASVPAIPRPVHSDHEVQEWFDTVVLPERETWVVDDAGSVVALLVLVAGWIDQLYVDPDHSRRGLGSLLMDVAKSRYPTGLDLWTFETNRGARDFYERHGFELVARTDGDNEEHAPDVRYHWSGQ